MLVSEFGLRPDQIYDLTPRQIQTVYFHARDKDGAIVAPEGAAPPVPADPRGRLEHLLALAPVLGIPADQVKLLKAKLEALNSGNAS